MVDTDLDTDRLVFALKYSPTELLKKPALDIQEQAALAGIPVNTMEKIYKEESAPPMFMLGRHRKVLLEDFLGWLKSRVDTHPYHRQGPRNPNGRNGKQNAA
jgi:hypothetical protein